MRVVADGVESGEILTGLMTMVSCKAEKTQQAYRYGLQLLARFLKVKPDSFAFERALLSFNPIQATRFIRFMRERTTREGLRLSDNTIAVRAAVLRKVFGYLIDIGARVGNPIAVVRDAIPYRQRVQRRPTKLIPFDAVEKLLDAPSKDTKKGIRDRAFLAVLFGGGLRRSEALKLNVGDIDESPDGTPFLVLRRTKAGTDQQQSLPSWAWERVERCLDERDKDGAGPGSPLFVFYYSDGSEGRRLSDSTVARLYKRYARSVGVGNAAPHSARATAVTMLKRLGVDDRDCAQFLRHSTTSSVETYDKRARGPGSNPGRALDFKLVEPSGGGTEVN